MFNSFVKIHSGVMMPMFNRQVVFFIELADSQHNVNCKSGRQNICCRLTAPIIPSKIFVLLVCYLLHLLYKGSDR